MPELRVQSPRDGCGINDIGHGTDVNNRISGHFGRISYRSHWLVAAGGDESPDPSSSSRALEGSGLDPLMNQPRAKKETPARMAVPQAWEYHRLYCRMAYRHWSRRVAGSGLKGSGGFGKWGFLGGASPGGAGGAGGEAASTAAPAGLRRCFSSVIEGPDRRASLHWVESAAVLLLQRRGGCVNRTADGCCS